MENRASWEEETAAKLGHAKNERLRAEEDARYWAEYTGALEKVLELDRQRRSIKVNGHHTLDPEEFKGKSVRECLMAIAARNNGLLVTADAPKTLVELGVYPSEKAARGTLYSTLGHSKKYFKKERRGLFRLQSGVIASLKLGM